MVEHELCKLGVTGSNPVASTNRATGAIAAAKLEAKPGRDARIGMPT